LTFSTILSITEDTIYHTFQETSRTSKLSKESGHLSIDLIALQTIWRIDRSSTTTNWLSTWSDMDSSKATRLDERPLSNLERI